MSSIDANISTLALQVAAAATFSPLDLFVYGLNHRY
jgi:hypothetical protein